MKTEIEGHAPVGAAAVIGSAAPQPGTAIRGTGAQGERAALPGIREIAARCALPLAMGLVILGTFLWGGFVTFVIALLLWKGAGAVL